MNGLGKVLRLLRFIQATLGQTAAQTKALKVSGTGEKIKTVDAGKNRRKEKGNDCNNNGVIRIKKYLKAPHFGLFHFQYTPAQPENP